MRTINEIIVHCTATRASQKVTVADVTRWHKQRGFATIGYHYLVDQAGNVFPGRPEATPGAHCLGHNAKSIGIAYSTQAASQPTREPNPNEPPYLVY